MSVVHDQRDENLFKPSDDALQKTETEKAPDEPEEDAWKRYAFDHGWDIDVSMDDEKEVEKAALDTDDGLEKSAEIEKSGKLEQDGETDGELEQDGETDGELEQDGEAKHKPCSEHESESGNESKSGSESVKNLSYAQRRALKKENKAKAKAEKKAGKKATKRLRSWFY